MYANTTMSVSRAVYQNTCKTMHRFLKV